ncbi:23S rRNA (adenine(2503)-C(2))-methyltransferase RlmN [Prosthecochloris sp. N3]|uniref:Probable dual-specificity RNA methyltransferase RlmN n=2 Tax=Chlorobiaceae TaxID=191412 RepID=A0ABR9XTL9_9CHLB|nr:MULTISPECIES: 23S rRNA (adenine(2503)-C(2))-methyltransferase RlmN [Prosthecochloris]MBF0586958.1 23S rRNA (adenine(2503)-C(2))-methyltransferase RlmN [Prosthecochloris ethylica]MBF0637165.1 23S rRNA (adenine(2503)-C(2))-methyltransferase RlmN [Prosthecochloris ethylica]NUK48173.1 23S rRNA (adenine(2503)-C(2))-methyltransferase RlmN [Prosthecochloris ethylica]RNA65840.1 23S rRNA (adenine(2503)-C(2))-methyltransferase RlmN [Prosthecochloris sp. ZM_2]
MPVLENIKSLSRKELQNLMHDYGEPPFRAGQIHRCLYSDRCTDFQSMTTLSTSLRSRLSEEFVLPACSIEQRQNDRTGGEGGEATRKYLVQLHDGLAVETVLIPSPGRWTVCVSTQVGCPLQCAFCATGTMGFTRNLNAAEIVEQVLLVNDELAENSGKRQVTNVVFMGMGEPLLNLDQVIEAIDTLTCEQYRFHLSRHKITVSTVGLIPAIAKLADSGRNVKLALSLHSADQGKRETMIPSAADNRLPELAGALDYYGRITGTPVTLVYMLLEDINDSRDDALQLARFARRFLCKINLIDYNAIVNIKFKSTGNQRRDTFIQTLLDKGLQVTVRRSQGSSISAACGQLAIRNRPSSNQNA